MSRKIVGIQGVDRLFQVDAKGFPGITETPSDPNEQLGQVGVGAPVAHRVRIGQGAAGYLHADESLSEARQQLASYFAFYNTRRPHSSLGKVTPDTAYFTGIKIESAA